MNDSTKSFGQILEEKALTRDAIWSNRVQEHIEREKKAYPERKDWLCLADGTINIPKIHESAQWYVNRGDGLELFELQHLCNDADAGMCTMNGDTHQVKITVRQLEILLSAYYRQMV
jgi:hypothetical protein